MWAFRQSVDILIVVDVVQIPGQSQTHKLHDRQLWLQVPKSLCQDVQRHPHAKAWRLSEGVAELAHCYLSALPVQNACQEKICNTKISHKYLLVNDVVFLDSSCF